VNEKIVRRIDEYLAEWKDATIFDERLVRGLGLLRESCNEIERIVKERDEVRKEVCHRSCCMNPQSVAKERNWDCYNAS
jgi:hypothetical protein